MFSYFNKTIEQQVTHQASQPYQEPKFHQYNTFLPPTFDPNVPSAATTTYQPPPPPPADNNFPPPSAPPPTQNTPLMDAVNALQGASAPPPPYNQANY